MAERRPAGYPKLKNYKPSQFMLPTSHYDKAKADRAVKFIENLCHTKGKWAGKRFWLLPWQEQLIRDIFGIVKPDGYRQFRTAFVEICKKVGKSELAAAVALYLLYADNEPSAEVYGAAADRQQASIVFDVARQMVEMSPALLKRLKLMTATKRIVNYGNSGYYQVLSAEVGGKHGFSVSGLVFDEIHTQPNRQLYDVLTKGSSDARQNPLHFIITTAGTDRHSIAYELHTKAVDILEGRRVDPTFYPVVYGLKDDEDWEDEANWYKVNPSLGYTVDILNDVINMAVTRKGDKKLEIVVHVDPDIPIGLIGDEIRIRQIIVNLVTNAIKYSKEGCVSIRVSQMKHDYGINLSVCVADTGIGIKEEDLEKLFSSFQQVDTKKNRSVEGTGLGLAISKRLITKMGGFINVSSKYGKGSEFRFTIPLRVKDPAPFITIKEAEKIHAAGFFNFNKFIHSKTAEEYRVLIREIGAGLHIDIKLYNSMDELKQAVVGKGVTHIFMAREEYIAEEDFFTKAAANSEIIFVQDRTDAVDVPVGIKCIYKPFYTLSVAALLNNENIFTNLGIRRNIDIRFVAPKARVLVVDDNVINLKVAEGLMRPYHMQVITVDSAKAAISMLKSKDFHIVFMDHMMPGTDGIEATKMIREMDDEYYKKLPIIALTANAVNGVREMFINAGMNDFIAKPIEISALDRVLKAWLPKELIQTPTDGEYCVDDRRKEVSAAKPDPGNEFFSPETGVFYTGGDMDAYIGILDVYVRKSGEKRQYIQRLFDEKSWKNYVIEVHALKSTSMTIGSKLLSERAKELECAGKEGNSKLIEEKNAALLELYGKVSEEGRKYLEEKRPEPESTAKEKISAEELPAVTAERVMEYIGKIQKACDAFDGDEIDDICTEAAAYACDLSDKVKLAIYPIK